ncbi:uncharacterized protein LOC123304874 [Chrysoperla carnea]|uniref:uncharacterized protein LOC123304874 n=1 Tax=Chrysoperla carnea TaxID=189513 RepID=UPI001D08B1D8|nr:uncharacterized protein LOC123304874 [Chrysoperla carnea]
MDILNVTEKPGFDDTIVANEVHTCNPYVHSFDYGDEIRIPSNQTDLYVNPSESYIFISGQLVKTKDNTKAVSTDGEMRANFGMFLFEEMKYLINGHEVDRCKQPGITSTIKNYLSYSKNESEALQIAGWWSPLSDAAVMDLVDYEYRFEIAIPLRIVFGLMEDFKKVIINVRHELVLTRARSDANCFLKKAGGEDCKINIYKIQWKIPHVTPGDKQKLQLLRYLETSTWLPIGFRSWDLYEFPSLPESTNQTWNVRSSTQMEKPRFVILCFQTDRKGNDKKKTVFDHCNIKSAKLYLNSEQYPNDQLNFDFAKGHYAQLYNMFTDFQTAYYNRRSDPLFTYRDMTTVCPMVVFNTMRQNDTIKSGSVDIRIEWQFDRNAPKKTSAFALIIHDKLLEYNPFSNLVRQIQ